MEIFDPPVPAQQSTIGLPDTLGYVDNIIEIALDDVLTGKLALLSNYIAAGFPAVAHGQGRTLFPEVPATDQQPLLAHPPHG